MKKKTRRNNAKRYKLPGLINDRPHITCIVGRVGSGKSHLCVRLLKTVWCGIYDEIIICSTTFQAQYNKLWSQISPEGISVYPELNDSFIDYVLNRVSRQTNTNTLLILDDNGEQMRKCNPQHVNLLVSNSRHYNLSICSLNQKLSQLPTIFRANVSTFLSFPACSWLEREALWKEVSCVDRKTFRRIFDMATTQKHTFLCSTIDKGGRLRFFHSDMKREITI